MLRLTQGSPPDLASKAAEDAIKPKPTRRTRSGKGSEGGRFADCTEDSGPVKPGNRAEEKTLTTRERTRSGSFRAENPPLATVNTQLS